MEMNRLIAYILQLLGVFGILFFLNFEGNALPFREAWIVLSILAGAAGFGIQFWATWKQRW